MRPAIMSSWRFSDSALTYSSSSVVKSPFVFDKDSSAIGNVVVEFSCAALYFFNAAMRFD